MREEQVMLPKAPCLLCVRSTMLNMPLSVFTRPLPGLCLWLMAC